MRPILSDLIPSQQRQRLTVDPGVDAAGLKRSGHAVKHAGGVALDEEGVLACVLLGMCEVGEADQKVENGLGVGGFGGPEFGKVEQGCYLGGAAVATDGIGRLGLGGKVTQRDWKGEGRDG